MRAGYGEHFCLNIISFEPAPEEHFEKSVGVNHTPLLVVIEVKWLTYIITIKIRRKEVSFARIGRLVLATGAVTAVVTGIGTVVHANHINGWAHWQAKEGADYAGVGNNKRFIGACDMERDGNTVYAEYYVGGDVGLSRIEDTNGSQAGCRSTTTRLNIAVFRVCEDDIGSNTCSDWIPVK
jgi:hypothetical protein